MLIIFTVSITGLTGRGNQMARQGMQKIVQTHYAQVQDSATFAYETISAGLDEEVLFKRIRLSFGILPETANAKSNPAIVRWALIQADTAITPTSSDLADDNRVVCSGLMQTQTSTTSVYDKTLSMRKLKGSTLYLIYFYSEPSGASSVTIGTYASVQLHYLEY